MVSTETGQVQAQAHAYVRAAYRYGVRHDLVERDPTADVRLPWLPDLEPATYANTELKALHAAIRSEREEVAFFLFAFAGLRLGEVAGLRWAQVDFDRWQIRLTGKGGKFRLVPLPLPRPPGLRPAGTSPPPRRRPHTGRRDLRLARRRGRTA